MMTITLVPVEVTTFLQSRRGSKVFRKVKIPPETREIDYNALPSCALELVDITEHVWARADIEENRGGLMLTYIGPPKDKYAYSLMMKKKTEALEEKAKEELRLSSLATVEVKVDEGPSTPKTDSRPEKKDDDSVQQVGRGSSSDGDSL